MTTRTVVLGGGLLGITTAFYHAREGHAVTVVESESVASGASHANGGMLTPSMADPWNSPGVFKTLLISLFDPESAMKLRIKAIPSLSLWGLRFLRNSRPSNFQKSTLSNWALADLSMKEMQALRDDIDLNYDQDFVGTMKVFRNQEGLDHAISVAELLGDDRVNYRVLEPADAVDLEPALADVVDQLVGAIAYPDDESGDAQKFCNCIADELSRLGAEVHTGVTARDLVVRSGSVHAVTTSEGEIDADNVVVAMGPYSTNLLRRHGIYLSIKPVKGYSVTFDASGVSGAPRIPVVDDAMHAAVVPIAARLRTVGTAEFTGYDDRLSPARVENLRKLLGYLYPSIESQVDTGAGTAWAGFRPTSSDGLPYIGATVIRNLYVNTGHGHLGWSMAAGSSRLLTDLITGSEPSIDPEPYKFNR